MKYETLIWSGCSHSFGSGMMNESKRPDELVEWFHPKLYEEFPNVVTVEDAREAIKNRAYPNQIGKKLGFKNIYNLSVQGVGIEPQLRKVSSFIIEKEDTLDFTKAVFCYQLPAFNRIEILKNEESGKFNKDGLGYMTFNFQILSENNEWGKDFFIRHFDFDFYVAKFLMYLYEYKGFLESKGITFLPFLLYPGNFISKYKNVFPYQRDEDVIIHTINKKAEWAHHEQKFPSRKTLLEKIGFWQQDYHFPNIPTTLKDEGYCNDNHFSPKGHDAVAENLTPYLKKQLEL